MFTISLTNPERKLGLGEVSVRRRDKSPVERMAVDQQRGLRAGDYERHPVPGAVCQPKGEGLDPGDGASSRHVVQAHLIAPPA